MDDEGWISVEEGLPSAGDVVEFTFWWGGRWVLGTGVIPQTIGTVSRWRPLQRPQGKAIEVPIIVEELDVRGVSVLRPGSAGDEQSTAAETGSETQSVVVADAVDVGDWISVHDDLPCHGEYVAWLRDTINFPAAACYRTGRFYWVKDGDQPVVSVNDEDTATARAWGFEFWRRESRLADKNSSAEESAAYDKLGETLRAACDREQERFDKAVMANVDALRRVTRDKEQDVMSIVDWMREYRWSWLAAAITAMFVGFGIPLLVKLYALFFIAGVAR